MLLPTVESKVIVLEGGGGGVCVCGGGGGGVELVGGRWDKHHRTGKTAYI